MNVIFMIMVVARASKVQVVPEDNDDDFLTEIRGTSGDHDSSSLSSVPSIPNETTNWLRERAPQHRNSGCRRCTESALILLVVVSGLGVFCLLFMAVTGTLRHS